MSEQTDLLFQEVRRLRDMVERQYLEMSWQQSELRARSGKAEIVRFGAGELATKGLAGNAELVRETTGMPPSEAWPVGTVPAYPLIPNSGFATYNTRGEKFTAIGISVCGLNEQSVEQIAAMVEDRLRRVRNFRPVFFIDITRTEILRRRGFSYEYLAPETGRNKKHGARLAEFNQQRVEFVMRKWGLAGIINFGAKTIGSEPGRRGERGQTHIQNKINSAVDRLASQAPPARAH